MSFSWCCLFFACAFALSAFLCWVLIPFLRKIGAGQNILCYVKEHEKKSGTPTMGGIAFIFASILTFLLFMGELSRTTIVTLVVGIAYSLVGLLDDVLKKLRKENLGLTAWQKIVFQVAVAVFASIYALNTGLTEVRIPFVNLRFDLGGWFVPVSVFVFLATVNCVNLTDGLDALVSSACVPFFLFFAILLSLENFTELSVLCVGFIGALLGYLIFNTQPASLFMGDTGSLGLGGFISCIGLFSGNFLYIALVGIVFVLSGLSVILQVAYFKFTGGKRLFKMTPSHHHFQQSGFSESKISSAYFALTLFVGAICLASVI